MTEQITSRRNDNIVRLRKLASSRSYRRECGEFVCEGTKLLKEAILWKADIKSVFTCSEINEKIPPFVKQYAVSRDILEYASSQKTPQDVIFTCAINRSTKNIGLEDENILLENIQDPGNLGTILRSAGAFGIKSVILAGECADPYNYKSVRASMGAVFHSNIVEVSYDELRKYKSGGMKLYGACLNNSSKSIETVSMRSVTVAIGNEGNGLSEELLDMCDEHIIIPIASDCESLNAGVAAAIVMWEMSKIKK